MRSQWIAGSVTALLMIAMPGVAAAPVSPDEFFRLLNEAAISAGVLDQGKTLVVSRWDVQGGESFVGSGFVRPLFELTEVSRVNPDGSMTYRETRRLLQDSDQYPWLGDTVTDVRCVRVDRCWVRESTDAPSASSFGQYGRWMDGKWHLLPKGRVTYQALDPGFILVEKNQEWLDSYAVNTFDMADVPGAGRVFTMVLSGGLLGDGFRSVWTVTPGSVTTTGTSWGDPRYTTTDTRRASFQALDRPIRVSAPSRATTGEPWGWDGGFWEVEKNSPRR